MSLLTTEGMKKDDLSRSMPNGSMDYSLGCYDISVAGSKVLLLLSYSTLREMFSKGS